MVSIGSPSADRTPMTRVLGTREAIVCSADLGSDSAAMASRFLPSKMSYLARPGSILAGWRIRNSLTSKGSCIITKLTVNFQRAPAAGSALLAENGERGR
jgi:hypothetical protein